MIRKQRSAFCEAHPELGSASLLSLFYSRARLFSPEAKATFLEPDLPSALAR